MGFWARQSRRVKNVVAEYGDEAVEAAVVASATATAVLVAPVCPPCAPAIVAGGAIVGGKLGDVAARNAKRGLDQLDADVQKWLEDPTQPPPKSIEITLSGDMLDIVRVGGDAPLIGRRRKSVRLPATIAGLGLGGAIWGIYGFFK